MNAYVAIAYRWGWVNNHHHIVRCTTDLQSAQDAADAEAQHRGGKYGVAVYDNDQNLIHYATSAYGEPGLGSLCARQPDWVKDGRKVQAPTLSPLKRHKPHPLTVIAHKLPMKLPVVSEDAMSLVKDA